VPLLTRPLFVVTLICAVLALNACSRKPAQSAPPPPVVPVAVAKVWKESIPITLRVVGTMDASETVQVKSQVAGQLLSVHFTEGQNIEKGALLFKVDARPYEEALRQAEAALARDRAQLRQADAVLARDIAQSKYAEADATRYAELSKEGIIARAQADQVRTGADVTLATVRASQAAIESINAAINSDKAAVDKAKLDLSYCSIQAPIAGRAGNLLVYAGNLVKVNDVPLVVLHRITPIFANFSVPEQHLGAIRRLSASRALAVRVALKDEPGRSADGRVVVLDNSVDAATGTIRLKAVFENQDRLLWPGQFVNVALTLDTIADASIVPPEAVQNGQQGEFVYIVKADSTVEPRPVKAGFALEGKLVIEKGVAPGETVVTDGQLRLFPGARIRAVDPAKLGLETQ
jgi:membrane fusion protein, multidrug efflux system